MKLKVLSTFKKIFFFLSICLFCSACSSLSSHEELPLFVMQNQTDNTDYLNQLSYLSKVYRDSISSLLVDKNFKSSKYLSSVVVKILKSNTDFFKVQKKITIYLIKDNRPLIFSLPDGSIYLSLGLIKNYVRSEDILYVLLVTEMIRMHYGPYEKNIVIPIGTIETLKIMQLTRIPLEQKSVVNKWAFYLLKNAKVNPFAVLSWIQLQNKNALDFSILFQDMRQLPMEEFAFKNFLIREKLMIADSQIEASSSKSFYDFLNFIKDIAF